MQSHRHAVLADATNTCIAACNMENPDPMGIHTGVSMVIAPSETLTNAEYFRLRMCALKVVRHLGVVKGAIFNMQWIQIVRIFRIIEVSCKAIEKQCWEMHITIVLLFRSHGDSYWCVHCHCAINNLDERWICSGAGVCFESGTTLRCGGGVQHSICSGLKIVTNFEFLKLMQGYRGVVLRDANNNCNTV